MSGNVQDGLVHISQGLLDSVNMVKIMNKIKKYHYYEEVKNSPQLRQKSRTNLESRRAKKYSESRSPDDERPQIKDLLILLFAINLSMMTIVMLLYYSAMLIMNLLGVACFIFLLDWICGSCVFVTFMLCKAVNVFFNNKIGRAIFRITFGKEAEISTSLLCADVVCTTVLQNLVVGVCCLLLTLRSYVLFPLSVPLSVVSTSLLCMLTSMLVFEYKWFYLGWNMYRRLAYMEQNWLYFTAFGFPITFLSSLSDNILINSLFFSLCFPLLIISSAEACPPPRQSPIVIKWFHFFNKCTDWVIGCTNALLSSIKPMVSIGTKLISNNYVKCMVVIVTFICFGITILLTKLFLFLCIVYCFLLPWVLYPIFPSDSTDVDKDRVSSSFIKEARKFMSMLENRNR